MSPLELSRWIYSKIISKACFSALINYFSSMEHLGFIIELLLLACLIGMVMRWIQLPYTIALVLVGLAVALSNLVPSVSLTHDVAFYLILPPILFQGAMHMDLEHLKRDWKVIGLLAIPGVLISAL